MTRGSGRRRTWVGAGSLLAALALLLASPARPEAASADCGQNSGSVCWENESCVNILFYEQCTTEYKYYPSTDGGGEESTRLDEPESDGCTWGVDYIGWEPLDC